MVRERGMDGTAVLSGQMCDAQHEDRHENGVNVDRWRLRLGNEELVPEEGVEPS